MTNLDKFIEVMNATFDAHFKPENMVLMCTPCGVLKQGRHACNHFNCLSCESWWRREYKPPKGGGRNGTDRSSD